MDPRSEGIVKWFNDSRGYGFINPVDDNGEVDDAFEYFVHFSSINMDGFKTIQANQRVMFDLKETPKGVQAIDVEVIK
jgi:CspA family cold shock protein